MTGPLHREVTIFRAATARRIAAAPRKRNHTFLILHVSVLCDHRCRFSTAASSPTWTDRSFPRRHLELQRRFPSWDRVIQNQNATPHTNANDKLKMIGNIQRDKLVSSLVSYFVSGYFEPSQPQRITSGLNTNFNLSLSHSFHKSLNHKSFFNFFFLAQTKAQILCTFSERKTRKNNNTKTITHILELIYIQRALNTGTDVILCTLL